jgi:hypothetical protein
MRINMTNLARHGALTPQHPGFGVISEWIRKFAPALFATYNYKGGYVGGSNTGPVSTPGVFSVSDIKLDFAAIAAARVAAGQAAIGAADVLELFGVRSGIWVPAVFAQTTKVEGAAATGDLGDGATAAGFISNHDMNALGFSSSLITTTYSLATAGGKLYTADDTIDLVVDSASVDVAVVQLFVLMVDIRAYR